MKHRRLSVSTYLAVALGLLALPTAVVAFNPHYLAVDVRSPFLEDYETNSDWCVPGHHTPWYGQWAFDIWVNDDYAGGIEANPNDTCDQDVYLRVSPSALSYGAIPDSLRAQVVNKSSHPYACRNQQYLDGGYQQAFNIYATYRGTEYLLGWVLYAHIDNRVYSFGDWINDPMNVKIGTAFSAGSSNDCWGGCHIHMEFFSADAKSCYQTICQEPYEGLSYLGVESVVGKLGGNLSSIQRCPVCTDDTSLPCATWDNDHTGCNEHSYRGTQDCAYYTTTNKCRPRGTSNCEAGCYWCWDCDGDSESLPCSTWDHNLTGCNLHGLYDTNKSDDTQDCAYYTTTNRCSARGRSNCAAGCWWCWDCDSCPAP